MPAPTARRAGLRGVVDLIAKTRSQAHGARGRSPIPARKGADEPLAAQQEENRSDVESADHHGPNIIKAAHRRKPRRLDQACGPKGLRTLNPRHNCNARRRHLAAGIATAIILA